MTILQFMSQIKFSEFFSKFLHYFEIKQSRPDLKRLKKQLLFSLKKCIFQSNRTNKDTESLVYIMGNQPIKACDKYKSTVFCPMTFFQLCDFTFSFGKALESLINPTRLLTLSSVPLGAENILPNFLMHYMTQEKAIENFVRVEYLSKPKVGKILSNAISIHKCTDFAEKANKALFDLNSHNRHEMKA